MAKLGSKEQTKERIKEEAEVLFVCFRFAAFSSAASTKNVFLRPRVFGVGYRNSQALGHGDSCELRVGNVLLDQNTNVFRKASTQIHIYPI